MNEKAVDYLDLMARTAAEERANQGIDNGMPEPEEEPAVDYLAMSRIWQEELNRKNSRRKMEN